MLLTSSIISGFLRLGFLLLFLFYLNRRFINTSESNNFLEFLVHQWFKYGSIIGVMLFLTIQLSIYDLLDCLLILLTIITIDIIGFRNIVNFKIYYKKTSKKNILELLKFIDHKKSFTGWIGLKKKEASRGNGYFIFILILIIGIVAFGSRLYFFKYDLYSLSGIWIMDLEKVIDFDSQIWFLNEIAVGGELAFANFYGKITDVSPEIALQSIAILEATLLSILMFWVIRKITPSKSIAPVLAGLSFALAYTLTPINIYFLLQHKPIFLGMAFGLPAMIFLLKPTLLKFKHLNYFFSILLAFITIGLIDLFTLYILFPPFVILAGIFTKSNSRRFYWIGLSAYVLAALLTLIIYAIICFYFEIDLIMFLHSNLVSVSSYTYIPQLAIPFEQLVNYYQFSTWIGMILILVFTFYSREENWGASFAFLVYFNLIVFLGHVNAPWIDIDLLNQAFSIFMPVIMGILVAVAIRIVRPISERFESFNRLAVGCVVATALFVAVYYQKDTISGLTVADTTPKQVLDAYDEIAVTYFPYSYAVVNVNITQSISTNKHFFVSYTDFLDNYLKQDSIYFKNIKNPKFFRKNPQYVIPKSVLLFVFNGETPEMYGESGNISPQLMKQLEMLRKRGRKIELFYNNRNVKVFEIINVPDESKVSDLIF